MCFVGVSTATTATMAIGPSVSGTLVSVPLAMLRNLLRVGIV